MCWICSCSAALSGFLNVSGLALTKQQNYWWIKWRIIWWSGASLWFLFALDSALASVRHGKPWNVLVQLSDDGGTEDWSHCWGVTVTQFRSQVQSVGWKQQDSTLPLIIAPFVAVLSWAETCRWSCPPLQMHLWVTAHTMIRTIMYLVSPKMESFLWFSPLLQTRTSSDASAIRFGCDTPQALR